MALSTYQRVFGTGPLGLILSLALLCAAYGCASAWPQWNLGLAQWVRVGALSAGILIGAAAVIASVSALPPDQRGRALCTRGIFAWLRHPLYAAFLSAFNFGLAIYLDHMVYLIWALALHPLWHLLIRHEEGLMLNEFGDEYRRYARTTGRFFPRLRKGRSG